MSDGDDSRGPDDHGGPAQSDSDADAFTDSAKWRCAWCDKPHDRNDPPCDNCGHHKFEKAVVPVAPEDPDHQREPVWVCPECGRTHQKNSPPCSRCGNSKLDRHIPDESDYTEELSGTSYLDLLNARYIAGFVVALVAGTVLLLGLLGVITLPGMGNDVPGSADSFDGVDLADTESAFVSELNDRRTSASLDGYERISSLDDGARLFNQGWVSDRAGSGSRPGAEQLERELDGTCAAEDLVAYSPSLDAEARSSLETPDALAAVLVNSYVSEIGGLQDASDGAIGVDVHAGPSERVYVTVIAC